MVTALEALRSTNVGGVKSVTILAENDAIACTSTIDFLILGQNFSQSVQLDANDSKLVKVTHDKSGLSFVMVTASGSSASTSKALDLDAAASG